MNLESLQRSSHQSLRVPFTGVDASPQTVPSHPTNSSIMIPSTSQLTQAGEYSLFGNSPSPTQGT